MDTIPDNIAKRIKGKRYICSVRCSTDPQAENSIPSQLEDIHKIGDGCGGTWAGEDILLPAVSGSKPGNRTDLQDAIKRKQDKNDFDVILSLVEDRWTRGSAKHGFWAEHEMLRHGIDVIHVRSDIPEGPHSATIQSMKFEAAREMAKSTSLRSTGGSQRALENGKICTSSHTNYGLHRLYLTADGQPLHIIRDMRDGTQQKLHHQTRAILEVYGTVGGKAAGHYRKQKSEQVFMVPGDDKEVWTVKWMSKRRWIDGWGGRRIGNELNEMGVAVPEGGRWCQRQVEVITENPIYCGRGIANLSTAAVFHKRSKNGPIPVEVDPVILATRANLPVTLRPPDEWTPRDEPYLQEFLPQPLRDIASARIRAIWERRTRGEVAKRVRNTHSDSLYLLTDLLRAKHDSRQLKGQNCGPRGHTVRYYAHPIARKDPKAAGCPNTTFRADVLEKALLDTLIETLLAIPELRDELQLAVEAAVSARKPTSPMVLADLQRELDSVRTKIKITLDVVNADTQEEAKAKLAELGQRRRELEAQVWQAQERQNGQPLDVDATIESLVLRLQDLGNQIESLPVFQLRQVLAALTGSMTADMMTREVTMMLKVPPMAISDANTAIADLCLQTSSGSSTGLPAQNPAATIATIHCEHHREAQKQCFTCRRMKRAA